ncbi:MAG: alkaline phosphodiesterase [Idiomarinaceae bacterium HL-53]|nr:MAG: alkaline phosphodiesterase [Idiomarinaceae bacterium HL-53]CUS49326.1 Predicted pyrophosphatase or phosphodiesterase, AlkP superfamily [Idiomarinaceae bacterium HL-53]
MKFRFLVLISVLLAGCVQQRSQTEEDTSKLPPTLIVISIDGARADYLDRYPTPALQTLANEGIRADGLQPVFPSKTFPNHYSLMTGLHAENHGIVDNNIYDPEFDTIFGMRIREEVENGRWWQGEPIWVTAEKQGLTAATFFFPGSEAEIAGYRPSYWFNYDGSISNRDRVEQVIQWLELPPAERPQLITLYFSDVDSAGHGYGPNSTQVQEALFAIDAEIGHLLSELAARGLRDEVDIMITSDHGMKEVDQRNHVVVDTAFDSSLTRRVTYSREIVGIHPLPGETEALYASLSANLPSDKVRILRKSEMPERFHYDRHRRIPELIVLAEPGVILVREFWLDTMQNSDDYLRPRGSHGYDNAIPEMHGIFVADGPSFKNQARVGVLRMVDLYNVMSTIIGVQPAPNDGDPQVIPVLLNETLLIESTQER